MFRSSSRCISAGVTTLASTLAASSAIALDDSDETKLSIIPPPSASTDNLTKNRVLSVANDQSRYNFPLSQKFSPRVPFPQWDKDWDEDRVEEIRSHSGEKASVVNNNVTKHIILIRHGQYDESSHLDEERILTPLGRRQAKVTGERIKKMIESCICERRGDLKSADNDNKVEDCSNNSGDGDVNSNCRVDIRHLRVSDMTRAKETAEIIREVLAANGGKIPELEVDEDLNEGRPAHVIPGGEKSRPRMSVESIERDSPRIERAFRRYFHRDVKIIKDDEDDDSNDDENTAAVSQEIAIVNVDPADIGSGESAPAATDPKEKKRRRKPKPSHQFEIIVCHGNVIRYMFLRALQLPPEAWLRLCTFNCSLTYFVVRPTGSVSCRSMGDVGHLEPEETTFSMHHGFNW